ncbi:MAG: hypothetical protein WAV20_20955 [Blastocatellia bacterium]
MTMAQFDTVKAFVIAHGPRWIGALIILILGVLGAKLSRRWIGSILNRSRVRDDLLLKSFFLRAVSLSIGITDDGQYADDNH